MKFSNSSNRIFTIPNLTVRALSPELMDNPHSSKEKLYRTLQQFESINRYLSNYRYLFKKYIVPDLYISNNACPTLVDIGCGGGDFLQWVARWGKKNKRTLQLIGIDNDPRVIQFAQKRCLAYSNISIQSWDVFELQEFPQKIDYISANNFIHHFPSSILPSLLKIISKKAQRGIIINDIVRNRFAYLTYSMICFLLWRNSFAFYDGRLSIAKGLRKNEISEMIEKSGESEKLRFETNLPFRFSIVSHILTQGQ